ncbi:MAG TPA: type II CAAX endopeptidase family protein [Anaerolineales bacterium]|nr:type II CAAX endopeptidase family protein [Anaerolineales bacterium]HRF47728.1 type II CAAX endopeptidase family protein [Anaerolineales bacterium]
MTPSQSGWRERASALLRDHKAVIGIELLVMVLIQLLAAFRVIPTTAIFFVLLGWISLRLRRMGWRSVGLARPAQWGWTIGVALLLAAAFQATSIVLIVPALERLTGTPLDLSQFEELRSNVPLLLIALVVSWTYAAFIEEMAYRGYLMNRLADVLGPGRLGWIVAAVVSSVMFGLGHSYQGISGVIETTLSAGMMAGAYFLGRRNLWLPILVHGFKDTIGFILIFSGLYP